MKQSYRLIDSGDYEKLEIIGGYKIIRPALGSPYKKKDPSLRKNPDAHYLKNDTGSGHWKFYKKIPESFSIEIANLSAKIKLTPFGHIGIFPEQEFNWTLLQKLGGIQNNFEVLNLFAYSGMSTLSAANAGYPVCHVDSSKGMIAWARENAELSNLTDRKIRWIEDDVLKFIKREVKRNRIYKGFILDPPTYGRGAKGEVWKIEDDLIPLIDEMIRLSDGKPEFVILSCHSTGFSPLTLIRILKSFIKEDGFYFSKELFIPEESKENLPGGFCAYFLSKNFSKLKTEF
ncbi:MAG TPA: class I SAM-dependent methyltransferase [Leptospiraceae bacterium]|nr:class I SAM-dependent methyltransferase [Leptospiraceae bacterium]